MSTTENPQKNNDTALHAHLDAPPSRVLEAFGVTGPAIRLMGGEGTCYRIGSLVLKPTKNIVQASWLANTNAKLTSNLFRVPKSVQTKDGSWTFDGWTASEFLEGEHRPNVYAQAIELSHVFHKALQGIPKPDWLDQRTDVFAIADKIAWGELPLPDYEPAHETLKKIMHELGENRLPHQLIHGDWGPGQILFHETFPPAVLDLTPYFRPAGYPIADMLLSAVRDGSDISILDLGKPIQDFDQLVLRALLFRTCTYIGFQTHPDNSHNWTSEIIRHVNLAEVIAQKMQ